MGLHALNAAAPARICGLYWDFWLKPAGKNQPEEVRGLKE